MADLTEKQRRFVEAYLSNGRNATEAYKAAYSPNASAKTAAEEGCKLLKHPKIAPIIAAADAKAQARTERVADRYAVTKERVLEEMARIAFADPRAAMKWGRDGVTLLESSDLSDADAAAIAEVSQTTTQFGGTIRVKMHNKVAALDKLGQHLKLWSEAQTGSDSSLAAPGYVVSPEQAASMEEWAQEAEKELQLAPKSGDPNPDPKPSS